MKKTIFFLFSLILSTLLYANDTIRIVAVGDMMLGTHYPTSEYLPVDSDCSPLLQNVKSIFDKGDIVFGNLEGVLVDNHIDVKKCNNPAVCYCFAMPTSFAACFKDAGFNLLSIANNHVGDFGDNGRTSTVKALDEQEIHYAGLLSCPTTTFEIDSVKYGFVAFAPNRGTVPLNDLENAEKLVRELDTICDIVIVSFHGGAEGNKYQNVPRRTETFLGENRGNVYEFAHRLIDAGADIVLGHGPHVTRAIELYKDRFITYSMGNFATYSRININGVNGLAPIYTISIDKNGYFLEGLLTSTYQEKYKPVYIDEEQRVLKVVQNLTAKDFPEMNSVIFIDDDGKIRKKTGE